MPQEDLEPARDFWSGPGCADAQEALQMKSQLAPHQYPEELPDDMEEAESCRESFPLRILGCAYPTLRR